MKNKILDNILDKISLYGINYITTLEKLFIDNFESKNDAYINSLLLKYEFYKHIYYNIEIYSNHTDDMIQLSKYETIWNSLDIDDKICISKIYKIDLE